MPYDFDRDIHAPCSRYWESRFGLESAVIHARRNGHPVNKIADWHEITVERVEQILAEQREAMH